MRSWPVRDRRSSTSSDRVRPAPLDVLGPEVGIGRLPQRADIRLVLGVPIAHVLQHDRGWSDPECGEWQVDALERLLLA